MNFVEAIRVIKNIIPQCSANEYDGILVKRLEASNTLDEGRTTNQTHIAISGEQMNMFPYLMADGYFNCDYSEKDEQLKKYFITQIPLYIYQDNISYLEADEKSGIIFDENKKSCVCASVVRSRRKEQADQVQLSLITSDDVDFVKFRKLLHTGDFLVILKHKERLSYDCIGIRAADENNGEYHLSVLNNKFYKLPTNTKVDIKKYIKIKDSKVENRNFTISELGNILKEMYSNAENKMQVASIHIFGIKYGKNIIQKAFKSLDIVKAAGINESYSTELQKALNIYRCLEQNSYGIYISDENAIKEEKEVLGERKTGAENILLYGVPGSGKSHEIKTKYCNDEKMMERVVFHPDYTYSDFVGQILPRVEKDKDGNEKLKYVFTPGPFVSYLLTTSSRDLQLSLNITVGSILKALSHRCLSTFSENLSASNSFFFAKYIPKHLSAELTMSVLLSIIISLITVAKVPQLTFVPSIISFECSDFSKLFSICLVLHLRKNAVSSVNTF